jgi:hypothetical protein
MVTSWVSSRTSRPRSLLGLLGASALACLGVALTPGIAHAQSVYVYGPPPPPPPPPPQYAPPPPPPQYGYGPPPPRYYYYPPDAEPPQALALGFDLEGAVPVNLPVLDGNNVQGGGGFKVRIGEQFRLRPRLRITPEVGYSFDHLFASDNNGNAYDWDMHRIFVGARLSFGRFLAPALYGHIGYGWQVTGDLPQTSGFAWDVGGALDLRVIPHVGLGVHIEYDELDAGPYSPEWVTFGAHADVIF